MPETTFNDPMDGWYEEKDGMRTSSALTGSTSTSSPVSTEDIKYGLFRPTPIWSDPDSPLKFLVYMLMREQGFPEDSESGRVMTLRIELQSWYTEEVEGKTGDFALTLRIEHVGTLEYSEHRRMLYHFPYERRNFAGLLYRALGEFTDIMEDNS